MTYEQILIPIVGLLLSGIVYFLKSLHTDFKRIGDRIGDISTKVDVITTEMKARSEILNQRMNYIERDHEKGSKNQ